MRYITAVRARIQQLSALHINIYAANAAFFIILAAIPSVMLLLALLSLTPLTIDDFFNMINDILPASVLPLFTILREDLVPDSRVTLISISAITTLWSASRGVLGLLYGLNAVYRIPETRGYFYKRLISMFYMILLLIVIILTLVLHVFGQKIQLLLLHYLPRIAQITAFFLQRKILILLGLMALIFTLIYAVFPNRRIQLRYAVPGALFSAAGWLLFSFAFSIYVNHFSNYSAIYGNLTMLILIVVWLYCCNYILLLGGVLNYMLERYHLLQFYRK